MYFYLLVVCTESVCLFVQVFVNFAKQQTGEDEDMTLHRRTAGVRKDIKISPVQKKTWKCPVNLQNHG